MGSVFISLVGTQVMGTLQTWMGLAQRQQPTAVYLLSTTHIGPAIESL